MGEETAMETVQIKSTYDQLTPTTAEACVQAVEEEEGNPFTISSERFNEQVICASSSSAAREQILLSRPLLLNESIHRLMRPRELAMGKKDHRLTFRMMTRTILRQLRYEEDMTVERMSPVQLANTHFFDVARFTIRVGFSSSYVATAGIVPHESWASVQITSNADFVFFFVPT